LKNSNRKRSILKEERTFERNSKQKIEDTVIKTLIWSVVLYGSETWTMGKEDVKRLEAFEMWIWRRMEKVIWTELKTNEEVLETIGEERSLVYAQCATQKKLIGHTHRGKSLVRKVIEGKC